MFKKNKLNVLEWLILIIFLSIPLFNIIFIIWGVLNNKFSQNLKNFGIAYVIWVYVLGGSFLGLR